VACDQPVAVCPRVRETVNSGTSGLYELIQYWYAAPHGADLDE
jgi:hypothetical protein